MNLLSLLFASSALARNIDSFPGYHQLQFNISRGDSYEDSSPNKYPRLVRRDVDGTIVTELENQSSFYSVTLKVGSEDDEVIVLIDTGSSDLWVPSSTNLYCQSGTTKKFRVIDDEDSYTNLVFGEPSLEKRSPWRVIDEDIQNHELNPSLSIQNKAVATESDSSSVSTLDCSTYGTFDESASTTFQSNGTAFYISYGDGTYALGNWGYDDVKIGSLEVDNLSFAVANQTNSTMGVLGIGLQGLETTYTGTLSRNNPYTYANLPIRLVQDGLINTAAYSLYLNDYSSSSGNLLFGGVDHAKYTGSLQLVPIVNTLASSGYKNPIKIQITLNSITLNSDSQSVNVFNDTEYVLLDSGTTLTYLPSDVVASIASSIGATYSSTYGYYLLSCPTTTPNVNITYNFQGVEINVPIDEVLLAADTFGKTCALAIIPASTSILGDSFLRSAYVVFDLANYQVALAEANYTDDEDIEVISSTVPSAVSAASYSSTGSSTATGTGATTKTRTASTSTASSTSGSSSGTNASSGAAPSVKIPSILLLVVGIMLVF